MYSDYILNDILKKKLEIKKDNYKIKDSNAHNTGHLNC